MKHVWQFLGLCALVTTTATTSAAQTRRDTLYLDALQHAAEARDSRTQQLAVLRQQTALRTENIASELRPTIGVVASTQYLSDVAALNVNLPGNIRIPTPFNTQYDSYLTAREPLFDASRKRRIGAEFAQAAEAQARVKAATFQQRQLVNDAFFALQLADAQQRAVDNVIADLTARRKNADLRVAAGTALRSEILLIDAELSKRHQTLAEIDAQRAALRELLTSLTGISVSGTVVMVVRDEAAADSVATLDARARPEFRQFERARETIDAKARVTKAQDLPRLSLVGRAGYGRPGLNALGRSFDSYWTAGVQLEWTAFNWGRTTRDMQAQRLQRDLIASEEQAFAEAIERAAIAQRGQIRALARALAEDDTIVALREGILRETQLRYDEGEVTSADYIARLTEATAAQLDRDTRRVRLREARARYLTTIGREVR